MTEPTTLSTRYGSTRSRDRIVAWGIAVVAIVSFAAWALWVNVTDRAAGIEWTPFESSTGGPTGTVTWHLTAPVGTPVTCAVRSVGPDMATNGWKVVQLPPSDTVTTTHTETIRAVGTAFGVDVYACWRTTP